MTPPQRPDPRASTTQRAPSATPGASQPGVPPKPTGTRSLVEQIVADQKRQKEELANAIGKKEKRTKLGPVALVILIVVNLVVWLIFPPKSDTTGDRRSPVEVERDLRLVVASAANEVDIWRRLHEGKLPPTLAVAGVADSGLVFVNVDGVVFEIRGADRGVALAYRSNMALTDFLDAGVPVKK